MLKILVTGATGRTGSLVVKKLQTQSNDFQVIGFGRSHEKVQQIFGTTKDFLIGDILSENDLEKAMEGCQTLIILTSATPQMKGIPQEGKRPEFEFPDHGTPEIVDWQGQKNQIDIAKEVGIKHIILVGSMGGTNPNHPLNSLGNGNILLWKRKAEEYLIGSGIDYTIIRAGGLLDKPDGRRELLVGKDDNFLNSPPDGVPTSIPRGDVANTVIAALTAPNARNKAFDLISKPEDFPHSEITKDWDKLFYQTTSSL
ncbi:SDR family oxidoreductase [Cyanobacterium sp. IPPAS B-1200]|uniref:SDR family oxidoreductase n=1 Tax=Cyanobacterium sp. IPPAS B-1200 TaxID=1562720 RepID=UPI0008526CB2|nr:SDR family oxidoreductase [Cyanobacterium sp. IPPAS B-1200]OEJ80195.1 oxidoreductase [Cyanobacterium sp. IPPAS B-1200]